MFLSFFCLKYQQQISRPLFFVTALFSFGLLFDFSYAFSSQRISFLHHTRMIASLNMFQNTLKFSTGRVQLLRSSLNRKYLFSVRALNNAAISNDGFTTVACIENLVSQALSKSFGDKIEGKVDPLIFLGKTDFGDYQCNVAMPLAKQLKMSPRQIADKLVRQIAAEDNTDSPLLKTLDISGPGFINLHLSDEYIAKKMVGMLSTSGDTSSRLGIAAAKHPQRVIIDFSSPNIAKEMHVVISIYILQLQ